MRHFSVEIVALKKYIFFKRLKVHIFWQKMAKKYIFRAKIRGNSFTGEEFFSPVKLGERVVGEFTG